MKKLFLVTSHIVFLSHSELSAAMCYESMCAGMGEESYTTNSNYFMTDVGNPIPYDPGCTKALYSECYDETVKIYSCDACKTGYTRTQVTTTIRGCSGIIFYYCKLNCTNTCTVGSTSSCTISNGTGTRSVTGGNSCTTGCTYSACAVATCNAGYYKKSTTECAGCAADTGTAAATSAAGNSSGITACYIPSGTAFSDATGSGTYGSNCYYSN